MGMISRLPSGPSVPPLHSGLPGDSAQQVSRRNKTAVGRAVKIGLGPVPRGMAPDRPPRRPGDPDADAKREADESCCEDANPVFAVVQRVNKAEAGGRGPGRLPKTGVFSSFQLQQKHGMTPRPAKT